jgi:hypothetical protein
MFRARSASLDENSIVLYKLIFTAYNRETAGLYRTVGYSAFHKYAESQKKKNRVPYYKSRPQDSKAPCRLGQLNLSCGVQDL